MKNPVLNFEYKGDNSKLLSNMQDLKFTTYKVGLKLLYKSIFESHNLYDVSSL